MKTTRTIGAGLACLLLTTTANATVFSIDKLSITRNGDPTWFVDDFNDGSPPPTSESVFPNNIPASYLTLPDPLPGPEQNSRLQLDTDQGFAGFSAVTGNTILIQRARVATNTSNDVADLGRGLKDDDTFEVSGLFDLIEPTESLEFYGIRLTDFGAANPDDNVQLRVQRSTTGEWGVRFVEADFGTGVFNELDSFLLSNVLNLNDYEQIELKLTKGDVASNAITASFTLIDTDAPAFATFALSGSADIFDNERWTRAAFLAVKQRDATVPLPTSILLIALGGIVMAGRVRNKSD